jgi:hypothetical protein
MRPTSATKGLLFGSFLYRSDLFESSELKQLWEETYGLSFSMAPAHNPLFEYYANEMGSSLGRIFFLTSTAFRRESLLQAKLHALDWEQSRLKDGNRLLNVDIGFLSPENFILATTKNYSHRVFIGHDIYADLTYQFSSGRLQTLPWTYPDYADEEKKSFFNWARAYLLQLE